MCPPVPPRHTQRAETPWVTPSYVRIYRRIEDSVVVIEKNGGVQKKIPLTGFLPALGNLEPCEILMNEGGKWIPLAGWVCRVVPMWKTFHVFPVSGAAFMT